MGCTAVLILEALWAQVPPVATIKRAFRPDPGLCVHYLVKEAFELSSPELLGMDE